MSIWSYILLEFVPILGNTVMQIRKYKKQIFHCATKLAEKLVNTYSNKWTYTRKKYVRKDKFIYLFNKLTK